ncbi:MAG: hypothetical protein VKJ25_22540, partial [Okeania sp.]|nr:hypothetical protein [Okeania sp.]
RPSTQPTTVQSFVGFRPSTQPTTVQSFVGFRPSTQPTTVQSFVGFRPSTQPTTVLCSQLSVLSFLEISNEKIIIGVMGPGSGATSVDLKNAYKLGQLIAQESWVLLTGGRNMGVMDAASRGAKSVNGLTIGILPGNNVDGISEAVDIPIVTDMGNSRMGC